MSTTRTVERQTTAPALVAGTPTSRRRKAVIAVVASGLLLGVAGGSIAAYVAQQEAAEDLAMGRAADSARLQGQADAYLSERAIERAQAADSQRLQEQAEWWLRTHGSQ